ncbi:MAG: HAD family hydrolase [Proteobacteria bacterium]|nr:HAD family hydrolase [Pseudomonadota bacterium]
MNTLTYKAVFIDLDGTLLGADSRVSQRNEACLRALVGKGVRIIIATGRPIESIRQLVGAIHAADPVISLSGSMVHKSMFGDPLMAHTIPYETMHRLLEVCRHMDDVANILLDDVDGFYALNDDPSLDEFVGMYRKSPEIFTYDNLPQSPVLSILVHAKKGRRQIYEQLEEQFSDSMHFTFFKEYPWIELSSFASNKGNAMDSVCKHLGLHLDEVIAIGDGANDLEMISRAGLGIAMDNADDEIKAVADRVAPLSNKDGVAIILEEIFALELKKTS